jgi:hypothetical protein
MITASLRDDEWLYLPELQGRRSNLLVGVSLHEGKLVSLAQWTDRSSKPGETLDWFCLGWDGQAATILTMAYFAVQKGEA